MSPFFLTAGVLAGLFCSGCAISLLGGPKFDPSLAWNVITTPHFRRGIGAEIKMDIVLGHLLPLRLRLGFAEGLDEGGERQTYFTIGNSF